MRVKQLWNFVPLPQNLKLIWERLTISRLTTVYFAFSVIHCVVQVVLLVHSFLINESAATLLSDVVKQGNATVHGFTVLGDDLRLCQEIPTSFSTKDCQIIWAGTPFNATSSDSASPSATAAANNVAAAPAVAATPGPATITATPTATSQAQIATSVGSAASTTTSTIFVIPTATPAPLRRRSLQRREEKYPPVSLDGQSQIILNGFGYHNQPIDLSRKCLLTLNWPSQTLDDTKRQDITFIGFQFWLLGMSLVAILNESIPHILASLFVHIVATGWSAWQIAHTSRIRSDIDRVMVNGACGVDLINSYWKSRSMVELPSMAFNCAALLVSIILTWRLVKLFGWQTFKRIGASITVNRVYKLVLSLSIVIQITLFFVVVSMALWIDQLCNGAIAKNATAHRLYVAMIAIVCVLLFPWLTLGWQAVRKEHRGMMWIFLGMSVLYLAGWGAMFDSPTFRWTFATWRFFRIMVIAGAALTVFTFILGIICRINFGKGLPQFLNAKEPLPGDDFEPVTKHKDAEDGGEKVDYPSLDAPMPTFSATYGTGGAPVPPSQMRFGSQGGPRLQTTFGAQGELPAPANARTRSPISPATNGRGTVRRQGSTASTGSNRTLDSNGKRWVIE